jgi:hypothetical protein
MSGVGAFDLSQLPAGWQPIPERVQSSLTDSDLSTEQTVRLMCRHIAEAVQHPHVRAIAERTSGAWGRGPRESRVCWDVFWFCKHHVRFMIDEHAVLGLLGEVDQIDFLISPPVLLAMNRPAGDCDDFTMLACALLEANGVPWEIVTVATEREDPRRWSHVYCRAVLPDGRRLAMDPTNGTYPGWEVPEYDVHRKQYWNMQGRPVDGPESIKEPVRMHGYVGRCGMGCAQRRGMGDTTVIGDTGTSITDVTGATLPTDGSLTALSLPGSSVTNLVPYGYTSLPTTPLASGAGSSINWNQLFGELGSIGTRLGSMALLPSGSSLLPSGAVISPSGAATGLLTSGSVGGISLTSILLIGGLGLAVFAIVNAAGKR